MCESCNARFLPGLVHGMKPCMQTLLKGNTEISGVDNVDMLFK